MNLVEEMLFLKIKIELQNERNEKDTIDIN
jgi:hypothetical protein